MNGHQRDCEIRLASLPLVVSLCVGILVPCSTGFAVTIKIGTANAESGSFAVYNTSPGRNGSPVFSNGLMTSAGSSLFPVLTSVNGSTQGFSLTHTSTFTNTWSATIPPLTSSFGNAKFSTSASTTLANGGSDLNNLIGVSFNSGTYLQSASTIAAGTAAVSFAQLHADFTNAKVPGSGTYTGTPGALISATGVLSPTAGSFVELANQGTITVKDNNGNLIATDSFTIIVGFSFNSSLQENTYLYGTGSTSLTAPDASTGAFSILDTNLFPSVSIPVGGGFSIDSHLTLVSDPGSLIQLGNFSSTQDPLPNFGSFAGGPAVPEPLALVQLGTGLGLVAGFLGWRRRARNRRAAGGHSRARGRAGVTAMLLLVLCLLAPGLGSAGTITVNDLSQPISASSEAFATTSLSIDSTHQLVTFDGTYLSSGGYPAPGDSVTYTVVFVDPGGSQSDATTLIIAPLANPTATHNTMVEMNFEGIVSTPINPGTGIFFIPEPVGWFDVARYLRGQTGVSGVPADLSVLVASTVPEPASLVMGGIAVVAGLGIALKRRLAG
jgi:hypothetical protein